MSDLTKVPIEKLYKTIAESTPITPERIYAEAEIERRKQTREDRIISATEKMLLVAKISLAVAIISLVISMIPFLKQLIG